MEPCLKYLKVKIKTNILFIPVFLTGIVFSQL